VKNILFEAILLKFKEIKAFSFARNLTYKGLFTALGVRISRASWAFGLAKGKGLSPN